MTSVQLTFAERMKTERSRKARRLMDKVLARIDSSRLPEGKTWGDSLYTERTLTESAYFREPELGHYFPELVPETELSKIKDY